MSVTVTSKVQTPARVEFRYRRPWEKDVKPVKSVRFILYTASRRTIEQEAFMILAVLMAVLIVAAVFATRAHRAAERAKGSVRVAEGRFLLAFSGLLAKMAMADGTVSADEVETVEKMFADMGLSRAEHAMCVGNFMLVQREGGDAKALARELASKFNHVACLFLYGLILRVAQADQRITDEEEALLKDIGGELGLDDEERAEFRDGKAPVCDKKALEAAGVPTTVMRLR